MAPQKPIQDSMTILDKFGNETVTYSNGDSVTTYTGSDGSTAKVQIVGKNDLLKEGLQGIVFEDENEKYIFGQYLLGYAGTNPDGQKESFRSSLNLFAGRQFTIESSDGSKLKVGVKEDVADQLAVTRLNDFLDQHPDLKEKLVAQVPSDLIYLRGENVSIAEALKATSSVRPADTREQAVGKVVMVTK